MKEAYQPEQTLASEVHDVVTGAAEFIQELKDQNPGDIGVIDDAVDNALKAQGLALTEIDHEQRMERHDLLMIQRARPMDRATRRAQIVFGTSDPRTLRVIAGRVQERRREQRSVDS